MNDAFFRDKKVVITGGSSGLGRAMALELARRGARVVIVARGEAALRRVAEAGGGRILAVAGDVSDKAQIHPIAGQALAWLGGVDLLVNGASELGPTPLRLLVDTECEDFDRVLQTNLVGP
ncbi:MAG TPA: SDR family oxidoreductase, partial [Bdellovibrionota bacterium]|nr:SDR family oxidoreductase [Bdellovibrionota bacterium]